MQSLNTSSLSSENTSAPLDIHQWTGHQDDTMHILHHPENFMLGRISHDLATGATQYATASSGLGQTNVFPEGMTGLHAVGVEVVIPKEKSLVFCDKSASASSHPSLSGSPVKLSVLQQRVKSQLASVKISGEPGLYDFDVSVQPSPELMVRGTYAQCFDEGEHGYVAGAEVRRTWQSSNFGIKVNNDGPLVVGSVAHSIRPTPVHKAVPRAVDVGMELAVKLDDGEYMFVLNGLSSWPTRKHIPITASASVNAIGGATLGFSGPLFQTRSLGVFDRVYQSVCNQMAPSFIDATHSLKGSIATKFQHNLASRESQAVVGQKVQDSVTCRNNTIHFTARTAASLLQPRPALALQASVQKDAWTATLGYTHEVQPNFRLGHSFPPLPQRTDAFIDAACTPTSTPYREHVNPVLWRSAADAKPGVYKDAVTDRISQIAGNGQHPSGHHTLTPSPQWNSARSPALYISLAYGDWN